MPYAAVNGLEMHYEEAGEGPPLLLLAGLGSDSRCWGLVLPGLGRRCRVIAPDNRGSGRTLPRNIETAIEILADDAVTLLDVLGIESVHLLGHSMGGFAALNLAARWPARVSSLILAATAPRNSVRNNLLFAGQAEALEADWDRAEWFRTFFYWIHTRKFFEDETAFRAALKLALEDPWPQTPEDFRGQVRALARYDGSRDLAAVRARTLVLTGRQDIIFSREESSEAAAAIPGAALVELEAAHAFQVEKPREFSEAVLKFIFGDSEGDET